MEPFAKLVWLFSPARWGWRDDDSARHPSPPFRSRERGSAQQGIAHITSGSPVLPRTPPLFRGVPPLFRPQRRHSEAHPHVIPSGARNLSRGAVSHQPSAVR